MTSIHSTFNHAGQPGPPHVVRFRWKPELDGGLHAGRETFKRIDTARRWMRDFDESRETGGWPGVREFVLAWRARDADPDDEPPSRRSPTSCRTGCAATRSPTSRPTRSPPTCPPTTTT